MSLEKEVLGKIAPSAERREEIGAVVRSLTKRVESQVHLMGENAHVLLVGSVAKDTYLTSPDIDLFILFDPTVPKKNMEEIGLNIGRTDPGRRRTEICRTPLCPRVI